MLDLLSLGSAEAHIARGEKPNGHLMANCVRNIRTKTHQNLIIGFHVTVENVGDAFYTRKQLLLTHLSHRNSVRPSVCHAGGSVISGAS